MVQRRELVTDTVGHVGPRGGTRVGTQDYTAVELYGHDGGLGGGVKGEEREGGRG